MTQFKVKIQNQTKQAKHFYYGSRSGQVLHSRLRLECSNLNSHLVDRHISDNRDCACGHPKEDTEHYLLHCPLYEHVREELKDLINSMELNAHQLLYGSEDLGFEENKVIFEKVQEFILRSKGFGEY